MLRYESANSYTVAVTAATFTRRRINGIHGCTRCVCNSSKSGIHGCTHGFYSARSDLESDVGGYAMAKRRVFDPRCLDDDDNVYRAELELVDYLSKHI